jgi:nucleotide-binding universal stress UspA family protein
MYKKMLVPLDGTKLSIIQLEYATQLARRLSLDLILLHVCNPEEAELAPLHQAFINHTTELVNLGYGNAKTTQTPENGRMVPPKARGEMVIGKPEDEVVRIADKHQVDVIIMATRGQSGIGAWGLGTVVLQTLRTSRVPLWLVPATIPGEIVHNEWPATKLLALLDGSKMAEAVLPHVEAVSRHRGIDLVDVVLLRVCEPEATPSNTIKSPMVRKPKSGAVQKLVEAQGECQDYLRGVEERLRHAGIHVRSEVVTGDPASEIIKYVQGNPFNLVFVATSGKSGRPQLPYGSVAGKVIERISSPIFVVRPH